MKLSAVSKYGFLKESVLIKSLLLRNSNGAWRYATHVDGTLIHLSVQNGGISRSVQTNTLTQLNNDSKHGKVRVSLSIHRLTGGPLKQTAKCSKQFN